jgi:hypothetical protein
VTGDSETAMDNGSAQPGAGRPDHHRRALEKFLAAMRKPPPTPTAEPVSSARDTLIETVANEAAPKHAAPRRAAALRVAK